MKFVLRESGTVGDEGSFYVYEAELDVSTPEEAYVKGREFQKLTWAMARGLGAQAREEAEAEE